MGGGVAVGDVNNDGLQDLYFSGNTVDNKLYLNEGDLSFEDISEAANIEPNQGRWITGCTMIDINADGLLDIYVSVAGKWATRKNILYINQGINEDGIPTFKDQAEELGLADEGFTIQTAFFDYDQDGDLDAYVANYEETSFGTFIYQYQHKVNNPTWKTSDHLYRNDNGHFTDVTEEAGILNFGLAVGIITVDFNQDGLTDIYVSNDFNTPDYFYLNNGDGTFTNQAKTTLQHTAFYGMGVDAADYNHDGLLDFVQMDMTPSDNFRSKANMASMSISNFWKNVDAGFHHQYMYNVLQENLGIRENGLPFYADVAKISGIDKTDWSWAPLFADFDLDGYQDLFVSNGTRRDINNKDFFNWLNHPRTKMKVSFGDISFKALTEKMPSQRVDNYIFKSQQGKTFEKSNDDWGLHFPGFSNGAAYADLDNDGDLELILNNIDSTAAIFKNNAIERKEGNYLAIQLKGSAKNPLALGTKITLKGKDFNYYHEHTLVRGYQSSVDPIIHIGLGKLTEVDSIIVNWPDNKTSSLSAVKANQRLLVQHSTSAESTKQQTPKAKPLFKTLPATQTNLIFKHQEDDYDDFKSELLLPHQLSRFGPALAVADVNQDGLDDLFVGGAKGQAAKLFLQQAAGTFKDQSRAFLADSVHEDLDALFFDADQDGDLDLYVISGSNELPAADAYYQDRLYINQQGNFKKSRQALPELRTSGGKVIPIDFDQDNDLDLLVTGRQTPQKYPLPASTHLLRNTGNGTFELVTEEIAPELLEIGMVTDAIFSDIDQDNDQDLILVGEWMPITIFEYHNGKFTLSEQIENSTGWWNSIEKADLDGDGDEDFLLGNLGLNYKYKASPEKTFNVYVNDYDENGQLDIVLGYFQGDKQFPVRGLQCSSEQMPSIKKKFNNQYNLFAEASLSDIYPENKLASAVHYKANNFANSRLINDGNGSFTLSNLPVAAQRSNINDFVVKDFNQDGSLDFLAIGNLFVSEVETPRNDANFGSIFWGSSKGDFQEASYQQTGLYLPEDNKKAVEITINGIPCIAIGTNNGQLTLVQLAQ